MWGTVKIYRHWSQKTQLREICYKSHESINHMHEQQAHQWWLGFSLFAFPKEGKFPILKSISEKVQNVLCNQPRSHGWTRFGSRILPNSARFGPSRILLISHSASLCSSPPLTPRHSSYPPTRIVPAPTLPISPGFARWGQLGAIHRRRRWTEPRWNPRVGALYTVPELPDCGWYRRRRCWVEEERCDCSAPELGWSQGSLSFFYISQLK